MGRIFASIPPEDDKTMPNLKFTTRMPDSLDNWVAASQFLQTFERKSLGEDGGRLSSVNISSPLSP
jgi:hypothetical protein